MNTRNTILLLLAWAVAMGLLVLGALRAEHRDRAVWDLMRDGGE